MSDIAYLQKVSSICIYLYLKKIALSICVKQVNFVFTSTQDMKSFTLYDYVACILHLF